MRRLAARREGGLPDREPSPRRSSVAMLAAGLVAVLVLVVAAVAWWPEDRSTAPASGSSAPRVTRPATEPAALQKQLDRVVEAGAPGVVVLVRIGERTWQGASGLSDLGAHRPARAGDRFRVGSVTKSFVATVVLQLVGEGRLGLDDTLERWLPGLVPGGERITVRELLQHTSGLYNYTDDLPEPPRRFRPPAAGCHRRWPQAAVPSRDTVLLQQHQLHPGRPARGAGHRPAVGHPAPAAHLPAPRA
jgi:CubicO group peptidase (beta-lactamase class C family)